MSFFSELTTSYLKTNHAVRKIIAINVLVFLVMVLFQVGSFLFQSSNAAILVQQYLTLPASFGNWLFKPWSIITYMFLHDGFFHVLFNMLWLHWLGNLLHEYIGNKHVYRAYFLGGIFGGLIYMLAYNVFPVFSSVKDVAFAMGASAGVLSVVVAAATLLPNYEIQLMFIGFVKLKWIAAVVVLLDVIGIAGTNSGGHIAHLGGALFGFLYVKQLYNNTIFDKLFSGWFKPKSHLKVYHKSSGSNADDVDAILDKISKSGYDSLTKKEKETLYNASKQ